MYRTSRVRPATRLPAAVDVYDHGISLSGMSKTLGLPGARIGWVVTNDERLLNRMVGFKDYTTICSSAPSEVLALMALRARDEILERHLQRIAGNLALLDGFVERYGSLFAFNRPQGGTMCLMRLVPPTLSASDFCRSTLDEAGSCWRRLCSSTSATGTCASASGVPTSQRCWAASTISSRRSAAAEAGCRTARRRASARPAAEAHGPVAEPHPDPSRSPNRSRRSSPSRSSNRATSPEPEPVVEPETSRRPEPPRSPVAGPTPDPTSRRRRPNRSCATGHASDDPSDDARRPPRESTNFGADVGAAEPSADPFDDLVGPPRQATYGDAAHDAVDDTMLEHAPDEAAPATESAPPERRGSVDVGDLWPDLAAESESRDPARPCRAEADELPPLSDDAGPFESAADEPEEAPRESDT